jgi:hypothetical protein
MLLWRLVAMTCAKGSRRPSSKLQACTGKAIIKPCREKVPIISQLATVLGQKRGLHKMKNSNFDTNTTDLNDYLDTTISVIREVTLLDYHIVPTKAIRSLSTTIFYPKP